MSGFPGIAGLTAIVTSLVMLNAVADGASRPETDARTILDRLGSHAVVRGGFVQTRELENAAANLRSEGEFIFWRNQGVYWATQKPVHIAKIYRHDKTLVIEGEDGDGDSSPREVNGVRDRHFRETLLTIFSFDKARLAQRFEQEWQTQGQSWQLVLTPKNQSLKTHLSMVELWGSKGIQGLRIYNDERLTVEFRDTHIGENLSIGDCTSNFAYSTDQCASLTNASPP